MVRPVTATQAPRKEEPHDNGYRPVATYIDLRNMVFGTDPGAVTSRRPDTLDRLWGIVIESGYPDAVATTIVLADGTMSLYLSSGGGLIGLGDHEHIADAGHRLLALFGLLTPSFSEVTEFPLPERGRTRVYLLTLCGILGVECGLEFPWNEPALQAVGGRIQELFSMIRSLADQVAAQREGKPTNQPPRLN